MQEREPNQPVLVKDIMTREIICVDTETPVKEIARLLYDHKISGVPVVDTKNNRKVVGIVTEDDLIMRDAMFDMPDVLTLFDSVFYFGNKKQIETELQHILATKASELMTAQVVAISESATVRQLATTMMKRGVNPVPVLDSEERLCGIVSRADIIRLMVLEQDADDAMVKSDGEGI